MMTDDLRAALHVQLLEHEGLRLKPYRDSRGVLTLGIGRNLRDVGISRAEAFALLDHDLDTTEAALTAALPWFTTLDPIRQRVLIDMAFNLGPETLLSFSQTLSAVARGDYDHAADCMLDSLWATQVGLRAQRLSKMMRTGRA